MALIIVGVVLVIIILWFISAQRKLVAMDENINNAITSTKPYRIRSKCVPVLIQTVPQQK